MAWEQLKNCGVLFMSSVRARRAGIANLLFQGIYKPCNYMYALVCPYIFLLGRLISTLLILRCIPSSLNYNINASRLY